MRLSFSSGLRTEIIANIALVTLSAILLVGTLVLQALSRDFLDEQILGARRQLLALGGTLEMLLDQGPQMSDRLRPRVRGLLDQMMEESAADLLWVDAAGRVMAGISPVGPGGKWLDRDLAICLREGREVVRVTGGRWPWPLGRAPHLTMAVPLRSSNGDVIGGLRLETPLRGVWGGLFRSGGVIALYLVVVVLVLVLFGSYLLSRNVLHPLRRLIMASERIARGDYELDWRGFPSHEMGRMADALKRMAMELRQQQEALKARMEELRKANEALLQAHQALVRSEKLASVGRLASGVAHEIGNPIGSILGYGEILLAEQKDPEARECLERILSEAQRIQRTVRSLLDLARPSGRKLEWVDVDQVVDETLQVIRGHRDMRRVSLERKREAGIEKIWADRDQVQQILVNLLLNALDALDGEGRIVVSTGMTEVLPEEEILSPPPRRKGEPRDADYTPMRRVPPLAFLTGKKGPYVFIRVEDTGCGIPEAEFQRIFEPFYTTKDPGKGTGLGLTVCQGIIESYGGRIQVSSNEGRGSCFTVYLPVGSRNGQRKERQSE